MPPSPVMRASPGRELKAENHKRGRSLESGIVYRHKEDDLALFNEVRNKERDTFLLQSNDNFDDFFSAKLRGLSVYKLGGSTPAQGESSDLLSADCDKNDYDWLITPPETPLFRSLDDEAQPVKPALRGRPRSQPVSVSRSPTMEKDYRSGRGSASPHRLSPSPRSGYSTFQSRSRPFSATCSSPPPTMRHPSPARRSSPSPTKQISAPRSSTPTPRRISTGTSASSSVRGSSPIKTSQGNSTSPKIRAWQTSIPGFSSEAPPNLCTSLADKAASYVRSASPAYRNSSRYGRQSMSPIASRGVASSHGHDQDPFSPCSKDSAASYADDDLDLLHSVPLRSSEQSAPRNLGAHPSFSRKPSKKLSSSAPKRSFDLVRQKDHNGPNNMFRPLLSSVPTSTFHAGKVSAHQHSLTSRNSSMTTSSSASCDQAASGTHDTEGSELNEDVTSDCLRRNHPFMHDKLFVMEHCDDIIEDFENRIMDDLLGSQHRENDTPPIVVSTLDVGNSNVFDVLDANCAPDILTCSKCGQVFDSADVATEGDRKLCVECKCLEVGSTITDPSSMVVVGQNDTQDDVQITEHGSAEVLDQSASTSGCLQLTSTGPPGKYNLETQNSYSGSSQSLSVNLFEEGEPTLASKKVMGQPINGHKGYEVNSSSRLNVSDGAGISLLLKRSSSVERHIVQSRSFTASTISYDDFSYVPDSLNSMRSSTGHTSASVSSSIDLGSSRQTFRHSWQLSGHKSDTENCQYKMPSTLIRSVSSMSSASGHMFLVRSATPSCHEDGFEETGVGPCGQSLASEFTEAESTYSDTESTIVSKTTTELSSRLMDDHSGETPVDLVLTSQEPASHENRDNSTNTVDAAEVPNSSSLNAISENEIENDDSAYYVSHSDVDSPKSKGCTGVHDASAVRATAKEFEISHHAHIVLEESRIILEDMGQANTETLTLEEAADVILFCSSIIHNLAYEAANFAIDKEALSVEALRPAVALVGKSIFERRDARPRKRSSRSQKKQSLDMEMETTPSCNVETDEKSSPCTVGVSHDGAPDNGDSTKPSKLESKCNCLIM